MMMTKINRLGLGNENFCKYVWEKYEENRIQLKIAKDETTDR
jgi:hypothetical protein